MFYLISCISGVIQNHIRLMWVIGYGSLTTDILFYFISTSLNTHANGKRPHMQRRVWAIPFWTLWEQEWGTQIGYGGIKWCYKSDCD